MNCQLCGIEVEVIGHTTLHYEPLDKRMLEIVAEHKIPFTCTLCGSIYMKYQPLRDVVALWPTGAPEKIGSIILPEGTFIGGSTKEKLRASTAIVLSFGPGYMTRKGKWLPTTLKVGQEVYYNKKVPWLIDLKDIDDNLHTVTLCGFQDIGVVL